VYKDPRQAGQLATSKVYVDNMEQSKLFDTLSLANYYIGKFR